MSNTYLNTPPPELFAKCYKEAERNLQSSFSLKFAMSHAIRTAYDAGHTAGANQELEACCEWLREARNHGLGYDMGRILADKLRAARRPKPPSLKEQALAELEEIMTELHDETGSAFTASNIRRALEALPE